MKPLILTFLAVLVLFTAGCYSVKVDRPVTGGTTLEERQQFFLFGLIGEANIKLNELCPRGVASFGDKFSPVDVGLTIITVGIYSPRTVVVRCAA